MVCIQLKEEDNWGEDMDDGSATVFQEKIERIWDNLDMSMHADACLIVR